MGKQPEHSRGREIWAVVLVGLALLLLLSLISFDKFDVGDVATSGAHPLKNFIGPVGAWIAFGVFRSFGLAAYVLMLVLGAIGGMLLLGKDVPWRSKVGAGVLLLVSSCCLLHLAGLESAQRALNLPGSAGGFVGFVVGGASQRLLGTVGTAIVFGAAYIISLIILINLRPSYWVALAAATTQDFWRRVRGKPKVAVQDELREQERDLRYKEFQVDRELSRKEREARKLTSQHPGDEVAKPERERRPEPRIEDRTVPKPALAEALAESPTAADKVAKEKPSAEPDKPAAAAAAKPKVERPVAKPTGVLASAGAPEGEEYVLPTVDLLEQPPAMAQRNVIEDLKANAEMLRATLEDFGINVELGDVTKGPTITRYELYPAAGVKVEKISSLSNNIALAMKTVSVRILTPVPGKGTVGIEVPNTTTTTVYLRDILESEEWRTTKARIPIALGRDVAGNPIIADLSDMPHLLIAGATGSGKTVCVNAILASLLYRFLPEDLRLVLIDPKVVEMQNFNVLPHLIVPVVTESKKVPLALRWVINEMEKRFQILAKAGVRNIASFNARPKRPKQKAEPKTEETEKTEPTEVAEQEVLKIEVPRDDELVVPDKLPYIIIVIDELADLMLSSPAERRKCDRPPGPVGPRRRDSHGSGHATAQRGRGHGRDQSQFPVTHCIPGRVQTGFARDSRRQRRRQTARQGRHVVPAAGLVEIDPRPGRTGARRGNQADRGFHRRARQTAF